MLLGVLLIFLFPVPRFWHLKKRGNGRQADRHMTGTLEENQPLGARLQVCEYACGQHRVWPTREAA